MTPQENNNSFGWLWWFSIPVVVIGLMITYIVTKPGETFPQPKVLDANARGMLLELPVVSAGNTASWSTEWTPASEPAKQAVYSLLAELAKSSDPVPNLQVVADESQATQKQLATRLNNALSQFNLGQVTYETKAEEKQQQGIVLNSAIADYKMAKKLMGALTPYLGGKVALFYDDSLSDGNMRLYFYGEPYFNEQGQATFDPAIGNSD